MIISPSIRTTTHGDDISGFWHLKGRHATFRITSSIQENRKDGKAQFLTTPCTHGTQRYENNPLFSKCDLLMSNNSYLIVYFSQSRRHLVRQGTSNNHHISLTRTRSEYNAKSIHIISERARRREKEENVTEITRRKRISPTCYLRPNKCGQNKYTYRAAAVCIISTAQHARPKVMGHIELRRPQLNTSSNVDKTYSPALFGAGCLLT